MGGAVLSVMDAQDRGAQVPHAGSVDYQRRLKLGNFLRAVPNTKSDNCTSVYRYSAADDSAYEDAAESYYGDSFLQAFRKIARQRGGSAMCSYRPVEKVLKEEIHDPDAGKTRTTDITYLGETVTLTYQEVWERIDAFGRGLAHLGIARASNVAIYQETCAEWFIGNYGIWSQGMTAVTVYANLGVAAVAYALCETNSSCVICGGGNARNIVKLMNDGAIPFVPVIHIGDVPPTHTLNVDGIELISFEKVIELGQQAKRKGMHTGVPSRNKDDLALIMYTSGTTGDPKGVMHTHGSLSAGLYSVNSRIHDVLGDPEEGESYCCYLPVAHILEYTVTNIFIQRGALVGFGTPRTLTDATARPHGDLTEVRPVFIIGVPRIFDMLKKAIEAKLPPPGSLKRRIYDHAYQSRLRALKEGFDTPYWNEKVFATTRALVGGRMRACLSAGAPISAATQEFAHVVIGPCVTLYGLTETICVGAMQFAGDWETNCGGMVLPGQEVKLLDTEHYKHTDTPEPRGELLQRGAYLFKGYYKKPAITKEVLDEDGWFHTGDVASITRDGKLRIVGRVKALAKNSLGEYIAMEVLEAMYSGNELVMPNGVCVLVHPNKHYITAVALTEETKAMAFAKAQGIEGEWPAILERPEFQESATRSLAKTAKNANRAAFECVRHVRVLNDEWTPENDVLTAALKLKRRVIDTRYADTIKELFADP